MGFIRTEFRLKSTAFIFIVSAIFVLYGGIVYSNKRLKPSYEQLKAVQSSPRHAKKLSIYKVQLAQANQFEIRCILVALFLLILGIVFLQMLLIYKHDQSHLGLIDETGETL
ncbi:hypothetical protein ACFL35_16975 [Candidatus Riflebacteria bacterium]